MARRIDAVVAGHICLDVIPRLDAAPAGGFRPGALYNAGNAAFAAGGAVANTGLTLHRLGISTALMGKIGDDAFGEEICRILTSEGEELAAGMKRSPGDATSYSVVLSPPGADRTLLHCPGCNDTFTVADLSDEILKSARVLHFGYPPLMRSMYADGGDALARLLEHARELQVGTSLDMAFPDPASPAGRIDWLAFLKRVLPLADVFSPSVEELLYMLDRPTWQRLSQKGGIDVAQDISLPMVQKLAEQLLAMGAGVVMIKLGDQGAYLKATSDIERFRRMNRLCPRDILLWLGQEAALPCYEAMLVGTTGAGDCTIAGLLCGMLRGFSPQEALQFAVAVGAASVEAADATSGVPHMLEIEQRLAAGWETRRSRIAMQLSRAAGPS
jgi:sugar/nucleoside kinase (ribokinase family)